MLLVFFSQLSLPFPETGLIYDYRLDDAGISLPALEEDEEEELKKRNVCIIISTSINSLFKIAQSGDK